MLAIVLLCLGLIDGEGPPKAEISVYRDAVSRAGKDASAQVKLALWCEAHGMGAERVKHLALAVLADPSNALARGLMGMVHAGGKWGHPADVGQQIEADPSYRKLVDDYLARRARTPRTANAQARLAAWCAENGLKDQAIAHYSEVIRLDPSRDSAWRHLGYRKQGHRWVKPEEVAADRLEAERQKHADRQWRPKLEHIRDGLDSRDPARRGRAEQTAREVSDPRAVPMIWAVMLRGTDRSRMTALQMLGQIDGPQSSNALASLAVLHPSAELRARATQILTRRDPRDVIGRLIGLVRRPFRYEIRPVNGPGTDGVLFVDGERYNIYREYQDPAIEPLALAPRLFAPSVPFDPYSPQNMALAFAAMTGTNVTPMSLTPGAAQQAGRAIAVSPSNAGSILKGAASPPSAAAGAGGFVYDALAAAAYRDLQIAEEYRQIQQVGQALQQKLQRDVQTVEATNLRIRQNNARILPVLGLLTGQDFGSEPEKWRAWWTDQLGYVYQSSDPAAKPTFTETLRVQTPFQVGTTHSACFAAGTLVLALRGPKTIESIELGDRVLAQDPTTGELTFRAVVAVHRNPPAPTFRLTIDGESVVATGIHRFWKVGQGWTMVRDLSAGDRLRLLGESAVVLSIEPDTHQPVYNLDVDDDRDFFVGVKGLLVHDFSFVQPVPNPFDRTPDLHEISVPSAPRSMLGPKGLPSGSR